MAEKEAMESAPGSVLFIGSDIVGRGENYELGNLLMQKFLHEVAGNRFKPGKIVLMNDGVKLVAEDSMASGELKRLVKQGVAVLACGTCLSRLQLADKVAVGEVSNMQDITDALLKAGKVISL